MHASSVGGMMSKDKPDLPAGGSERIVTGIDGLDKILGGGFPKSRTILLAGGPGCGKTILSTQFLCNGARLYSETGVYVTLGETPRGIVQNLSSFDFKINELVMQRKLAFIDLSISGALRRQAEAGKKIDFAVLKDLIRPVVEELGAKRLVIDPITAMGINRDLPEIRERLTEFATFASDFGCTTLLVSETPIDQNIISVFGVEEFVVDGVIVLHNMRRGGTRVRGVEIVKMRGTDHGAHIYPVQFSRQGLLVFPEERVHGDDS